MQEYASAILRELPMIDRVKNNEELDGAIYEMENAVVPIEYIFLIKKKRTEKNTSVFSMNGKMRTTY